MDILGYFVLQDGDLFGGEGFIYVEMAPLILAEVAKMEGSPSTLWGWPKYIPLQIISLSSS